MRVLCVDDEQPAVDELAYLLGRDERVGEVLTCTSATEALQRLQETLVDAVFLDIQMPALTGLELAGVLSRFRTPPALVFVTAHEEHAVAAFGLRAVDYVLKPVRPERLAETLDRLAGDGAGRGAGAAGGAHGAGGPDPAATSAAGTGAEDDHQIAVELGGVTRFVRRRDITHVEAQGDYARLHTPGASHLVRIPLTQLEQEWGPAGFLRIHRSLLVNLARIREVRVEVGRWSVVVGGGEGPGAGEGVELGVSRRHTRQLKDRLTRSAG